MYIYIYIYIHTYIYIYIYLYYLLMVMFRRCSGNVSLGVDLDDMLIRSVFEQRVVPDLMCNENKGRLIHAFAIKVSFLCVAICI